MKTLFSIIIALITFAVSNNSSGQTTTDTVKTATVKVIGITCKLEESDIKKKLLSQEGIDETTYSSGTGIFTVKYHSSTITEKKISEVIEASPSCENPNQFPYKVKSIKSIPIKK
jgi:copper chaperone CopZ